MSSEQSNVESFSGDVQDQEKLLNDPNFGTILIFLEKFRSVLDLPVYSYRRLENHLLENEKRVPLRLVDFHFILLKRLSLGKNSQREKFDSIISKFASKFDLTDGEQLTKNGYLKSSVHLKVKILKNLFESQFDLNQNLKNSLLEKSAREIKSTPIGRDRFGVSYWFFMDEECYIRLFREDIDVDRSWSFVAKNRDEFENFVKLLFTDEKLRKKFNLWKVEIEEFDKLSPNSSFEENFGKKLENLETPIAEIETSKKKRGRGRPARKLSPEIELKLEEEEIEPVKRTRSQNRISTKNLSSNFSRPTEEENFPLKRKRGRPRRSEPAMKSSADDSVAAEDEPLETNRKFSSRKKRKSKIETEETKNLRRSVRNRKSTNVEPNLPKTSSKKRSATEKNESTRVRGRRKTGTKKIRDDFCGWTSSSTDEENFEVFSDEQFEDEEEEEENLSNELDEQNFFEIEQNDDDEHFRTAKTAQNATTVTSCCVCEKTDRPEVLLLCDFCDDAYHIDCLTPILISVPDADWFCPFCEQKKLVENLIEKFQNFLQISVKFQQKQNQRIENRNLTRKTKQKIYSSDETLTESEIEEEKQEILQENILEDESTVSMSQTNENSNYSSSNVDDFKKNISQRGRHRRTRFDMNKMLNNSDESDQSESEEDDEYVDNAPQIAHFDLQLPKKMTRLLNFRARPPPKLELPNIKPRPIRARPSEGNGDLNEHLGSPLVYVNGDGSSSRPMKSVVTNSKQTLKIVRRWHDVQRRSRLKINAARSTNETTSDCADENAVFCPDDSSPPRSNENNLNQDSKDDDSTIIRSKISFAQPVNLVPVYKSSTKNLVKKTDVNFDRLTRDIQYAVSSANNFSNGSKTPDQQIKRTQQTNFSPYLSKVSIRPLPVLLPKPSTLGYKIFKSKDPVPVSATNGEFSNVFLSPSSSSSIVDNNDERSAQQ